MKMLILRGKAGYYDDTDWPDGALHEQPALDYATRRGYDGTVLPMPGKAYKGSPQHLAALRRVGLVESRREGTSVFYRAADEKVFDLLAAGRALVARQLEDQQSMLRELAET